MKYFLRRMSIMVLSLATIKCFAQSKGKAIVVKSKINKSLTYCYRNEAYAVKIVRSKVTIYYSDLNHLDRSYTDKGYINKGKIYIKTSPKSLNYVWEFTLGPDNRLSMYDNNKKQWTFLYPCEDVEVIEDADNIITDSTTSLNSHNLSAPLQSNKNNIYTAVEQSPEFPGGVSALEKFINANIKYSDEMQKANISGKVVVSFVVEVDGSLSNVNTIKDLGLGSAEEAKRIFALSPKWKPGLINGKPVRVLWNLPVIFDTANE